jgi:hypothetical protein
LRRRVIFTGLPRVEGVAEACFSRSVYGCTPPSPLKYLKYPKQKR